MLLENKVSNKIYREVQESQTLLINSQSKRLLEQNKEIFKFGFGQSPFLPPLSVIESLKKNAHRKEYTEVQGDRELRSLMSDFHYTHNSLKMKPEDILIATGSKILLFNILMAFKKIDVFIPAPAWVSYGPQARLLEHNVIRIPVTFEERWRISESTIEKAMEHKKHTVSLLILNYPGNPDGLTYQYEELTALAQCLRSHDFWVISDEIYGLLDHQNEHLSFANFYPEKTLTTTGLSKWCGAGGWRFGAVFLPDVIDPDFKKALIGIGSETYSCAPAPVQQAAKVAYGDYHRIENYVRWQTQILSQIGNYCYDRLSSAGLRIHPPEGGFYFFSDFSDFRLKLESRGITSSDELCTRILRDTGIALLPASAFGFDDAYLAARVAYVDFNAPIELAQFNMADDCPRVLEGIERLCKWLRNL